MEFWVLGGNCRLVGGLECVCADVNWGVLMTGDVVYSLPWVHPAGTWVK